MQANVTLDNPLRVGLSEARTVEPCIVVIFGATGDLTQRKLLPALYSLAADQPPLPNNLIIVGVARRPWTTEQFRKYAEDGVKEHARQPYSAALWETFAQRVSYEQVEFGDTEAFERLGARLNAIDAEHGTAGNRIFYLATAPEYYSVIAANLGKANMVERTVSGPSYCRLVVEKPFGRDQASAAELNGELNKVFKEDQIYRIDHYLGKETVQNILVMRFSNTIFEPIWSADHIDHVQITVAESIGVENRGGYYEESGALRDMVQNHMLQLMTLVAMDQPLSLAANDIRQRKVEVLREIGIMSEKDVVNNVVRGQYEAGQVNYQPAIDYRDEQGVSEHSQTETFVALKLAINSQRWAGTPFYLRTGKRLPERVSEIAVKFKRPRFSLFKDLGGDALPSNLLSLRIQPNEGISLRFDVKLPGQTMQLRAMNMDFAYGKFDTTPPEAYERLLLDAMRGDSTLFTRREETEMAWGFVDAIESAWHGGAGANNPLVPYTAGTWGPRKAMELIERDGRSWRRL